MRRNVVLVRGWAVLRRRLLAGLVVVGVLAGLPGVPWAARVLGRQASVASADVNVSSRVSGMAAM